MRTNLDYEYDVPLLDDEAVDRFAAAMKKKLAECRSKGKSGWNKKDECSIDYLSGLLAEQFVYNETLDDAALLNRMIEDGKAPEHTDYIDVANLAMMLYFRTYNADYNYN